MQLYHLQDLAPPGTARVTGTLVLGLIRAVHVRAAVLAPGGETIDPARLRPIARLGGVAYSRLGDVFDIPRLTWGKAVQADVERAERSGGG